MAAATSKSKDLLNMNRSQDALLAKNLDNETQSSEAQGCLPQLEEEVGLQWFVK